MSQKIVGKMEKNDFFPHFSPFLPISCHWLPPVMAKRRIPLYGIIDIFRDFLSHNVSKY